ncbi:energy transducer TonB [Methylosinus sp. H3A]|uniref:energy transducer TonB n=1 Tax=Methylosinus sp. H3A TaxID=2785786 RepID=UPI0018C22FF3|nr:energy transducer TonB [Methylosinus sp. H3A]MBG0812002.1 energy transducer TonB [Methylosinus sp. H3A]
MIFRKFQQATLFAAACCIAFAPTGAAARSVKDGAVAASPRRATSQRDRDSYPERVARVIQARIIQIGTWPGEGGRVSVKYRIRPDGRIENVQIVSSPSDRLAEETYRLLTGLRVPRPPSRDGATAHQNVNFDEPPPMR